MQKAGTAEDSVKPVVIGEKTVCCKMSVRNAKGFAYLEAHIEKRGDDYAVDLKEQGVKAFEGQAIAASVIGASPVSYTHLDVYKRQNQYQLRRNGICN